MYKHTQWLHIRYQHIYSQIELIVINQERSPKVFLNDQMLIRIDRLDTLSYKYAFPLTHALRFHYKVDFGPFFISIINVIFELIHLIWQQPCLRKELIVFGKLSLHFLKVAREVVLSCDLKHAWEVIDSLVRFYFLKHLECRRHVCPRNIPLSPRQPGVLLTYYSPSEYFLAYFLYYIILSIECIECNPHWFCSFCSRNRGLIAPHTVLSICGLLFRRCPFLINNGRSVL